MRKTFSMMKDLLFHPFLWTFLLQKIKFDFWKRKYQKNNDKYENKISIEKKKLYLKFKRCFKNELSVATAEMQGEKAKEGYGMVFCFWYQGEESMPDLIRKCYQSILLHSGAQQVVLLTKDNLSRYVAMDDIVLKRLSQGTISLTHFSDIVRMRLLSKYNAIWMDLTLFFIRDLPQKFFDYPFISIKAEGGVLKGIENHAIYPDYPFGNIYFMGGRNSDLVFSPVYRFYVEYLKKYRFVYYYFQTYFVLQSLYEASPDFRKAIDAMEENDGLCERLLPLLNQPFDQEADLDIFDQNTYFYKLNRHVRIETGKDQETVFEAVVRMSSQKEM